MRRRGGQRLQKDGSYHHRKRGGGIVEQVGPIFLLQGLLMDMQKPKQGLL